MFLISPQKNGSNNAVPSWFMSCFREERWCTFYQYLRSWESCTTSNVEHFFDFSPWKSSWNFLFSFQILEHTSFAIGNLFWEIYSLCDHRASINENKYFILIHWCHRKRWIKCYVLHVWNNYKVKGISGGYPPERMFRKNRKVNTLNEVKE